VEVLLIGFNPIRGQIALRRRKVDFAAADHRVQPPFQLVFYARVPGRIEVGLRPEIADAGGAAQFRRDEVIHFVSVRPGIRDPVLLKDLALQRDRNSGLRRDGIGTAHIVPGQGNRRAGSKPRRGGVGGLHSRAAPLPQTNRGHHKRSGQGRRQSISAVCVDTRVVRPRGGFGQPRAEQRTRSCDRR